jgi:hypothetical protein
MSGSPWHLALSISALRDSRLFSASLGWDDWRNGTRVFVDTAVPPFGTWAQRALDVAGGIEDASTAALSNSGLTAWLALAGRAPVKLGQTGLILGAAGAVGSVAVQAARVLGAGRVSAAVQERSPRHRARPPGVPCEHDGSRFTAHRLPCRSRLFARCVESRERGRDPSNRSAGFQSADAAGVCRQPGRTVALGSPRSR